MLVTADARNPLETASDLLVVPLAQIENEKRRLPSRVAALDRELGGRIEAALESGDFRGKPGQQHLIYPDGAVPARRVLLIGLGKDKGVDADALRSLAGSAVKEARSRRATKVQLAVPGLRRVKAAGAAQALAEGAVLGAYRYDGYKQPGDEPPAEVAALQLSFEKSADLRAARSAAKRGVILAESQNVARDLSNSPGNDLPPATLAREAQKVGKAVGLKVKVLGPAELKKRKMEAILAVGAGSANSPRLIAMEHVPKRKVKKGETICFVGKGVTFDSGGISIKPAAGMDEMKHDMAGAAAVVGALRACALLNVPYHVVGVIGAAENMPSGTAYRPGDVVKAASGKTIEVLNTDAEGRVVLADAFHYAKTEYEPQAMVDLATLTGACVVALGRWATGAFGNNEKLVDLLRKAGDAVSERVWPMPLLDGHRKAVKSEIADVKNTGAGREAGASTAAAFLDAFVGETPWVHLDIAGTGWSGRAGAYQPRGATGVGVRLLVELLDDWKKARLD
jgi:leucyl aminopeptidase